MRKFFALSALTALAIAGFVYFAKYLSGGKTSDMYEKVGKGIDEGLKESKAALDKASAHVQNVFEHVKNLKT